MFEPSPEKLVIVLIIALIILGPKRLPEVGHSLGKGLREFKDGISGHESEPPDPAPAASLPQASSFTPPAPPERTSTPG